MSNWSFNQSQKVYRSETNMPKNRRCQRCGKAIVHRTLCWSCYYQKRKDEGRC